MSEPEDEDEDEAEQVLEGPTVCHFCGEAVPVGVMLLSPSSVEVRSVCDPCIRAAFKRGGPFRPIFTYSRSPN